MGFQNNVSARKSILDYHAVVQSKQKGELEQGKEDLVRGQEIKDVDKVRIASIIRPTPRRSSPIRQGAEHKGCYRQQVRR